MDESAKENKEMPEKMGAFPLQGEGDDADGIDDAADESGQEERQVFPDHAGQEKETAPAQDNEEGKVEGFGPAGAEDRHKDNTGDDDCPLDAAKDRAQPAAPEKQPHGRESSADEQVDGNIVKTPPEPFDAGTPAEGMVQAAHQEHDNQAQAVDQGTEKAGGSTGFYQEQHQPRDTEQRFFIYIEALGLFFFITHNSFPLLKALCIF